MNDLIHRNASPWISDLLDHFPVVVLQGGRQVGKSTLAADIAGHRHGNIVTMDNDNARTAATTDPAGFLTVHGVPNSDSPLVIDEIQRAPELLLAIKEAVDSDRKPGRFLLTGSADLHRIERTPDSLAGRSVAVTLGGFSQGELRDVREDFVHAVVSGALVEPLSATTLTRSDYSGLLARGSFPELRSLPNRMRSVWLDAYVSSLVNRDMAELMRLTDPARVTSALRLLAANQAGELVRARISKQTGIPESSLVTYLTLLRTLYLTDELPPWTPNLARWEIGRPKVFLPDSALAMQLSGISEDQLTAHEEYFGALLEGFVAAELRRQQTWSEDDYRLHAYRNSNNREVDCLIELADGRVIAIEVKASSTVRTTYFRHLEFLREELGDRLIAGIVLSTAPEPGRFGDRMWALPVSSLWELGTSAGTLRP